MKNEIRGYVEFIKIERGENTFGHFMNFLFEKKINSILVEGGANTIDQLIKSNLWDEMKIFNTPKILSTGIIAPASAGKEVSTEKIYDNTLITRHNA